jgi:iron complex outermembrane recepter protein
MRKKRYQKALAVSGLLALAGPSMAQERASTPNQSDTLEEIVVTGIRGSLQRSLDIKRESAGVVDAISSEDIGKFPDSNVAASLQRVPGVSIQRNGQRGEPTGVTVRGFGGDFNETLYDGRRISTASGGRAVDFSTVGSDFVGTLSVMKTPDVTLSSSSIGATINVQFPKPFDNPGLKFVAAGSGTYQDESGDARPSGGALFSDTFANDTMGILFDAMYSDRTTTTNRDFVSGWEGGRFAPCQLTSDCTGTNLGDASTHTIVGWWQQQYGAEQSTTSDKRIDGRLAFQWRPSDSVLLTLDDNYSREKLQFDTQGFALWFNRDDLRNVQIDGNGTVVNFIQPGTPMDLNSSIENRLIKTNQVGLNLQYDRSENLGFNFDVSYAKSEQNPNGEGSDGADIGYGGTLGTALGVKVTGDSSSSFPQLTTYGPAGSQADYINPADIGSHVLVRASQQNTDTIKQARFTTTFKQDNLRADIGLSYLHDEYTLQNSNTFANNFWQTFSGYGPPSGRSSGIVLPTSLYHGTISTSGFIPGFSGGSALPPSFLKYNPRELYSYLQGLGDPYTHQVNGFNYPTLNNAPQNLANGLAACAVANPPALCNYHGSIDLALDPGSIQDITEKTLAGFIRLGLDTQLGSMPFHVNAGVREERTDLTSAGVGRVPTQLAFSSGDPTLLTTTFSPTQPISTDSSYSFLLPSMDLKLELTDTLHLRFDVSRTLTRPGLNTLTPVLNVGSLPRIGALTANGGNPELKPYLSDNFDLGTQWYYQSNSYASINLFVKDVTNFIVQGTQRQTISSSLIDPSTGQAAVYTVSQRVNGPSATVDGVELAWQHVFGETGFGFNANITLVDTDKPYKKSDISQSGFAVTGLANSANLVAFYDKSGFEARVAANWRDEYLLQFGQNQNNSNFGAEPTFVNSSLQIDLTTSYQFTEQLNVYFEALNVTNETMSTHGRYDNELLDVFNYGRRYALGVRFRM